MLDMDSSPNVRHSSNLIDSGFRPNSSPESRSRASALDGFHAGSRGSGDLPFGIAPARNRHDISQRSIFKEMYTKFRTERRMLWAFSFDCHYVHFSNCVANNTRILRCDFLHRFRKIEALTGGGGIFYNL